MKTKFIYRGPTLTDIPAQELWDPVEGWTCHIEVGEGGLRTDTGWKALPGSTMSLAVVQDEWRVTETSWLCGEHDAWSPFGNILPNEPATRTAAEMALERINTIGMYPIYFGADAGGPEFRTEVVPNSDCIVWPPKCDCGAEKCRTTHSTWCSAYKGDKQ